MLYHVPIEPYDRRYTADWISQFETEFKKNNVGFETVLGENVSSIITQGSVLDACGTNIYKGSQIKKLILMIQSGKIVDNDVIFFSDLWFPGIESLFYIRNITKIDFKIVGILHAGTYDESDFTTRAGMRKWGKYQERAWLEEIDSIFLATQFHKEMILNNCIDVTDSIVHKLHVTGIPFYAKQLQDKYPEVKKENIIVFPHRTDVEKHPELFDKFSEVEELRGFRFIKTIDETTTRDEYFNLLRKSKIMISFADQETFGYSTLEAMALGNIVIVPDKLSYKETVPSENRYDSLTGALRLVLKATHEMSIPDYPDMYKWEYAVRVMVRVINQKWGGILNV